MAGDNLRHYAHPDRTNAACDETISTFLTWTVLPTGGSEAADRFTTVFDRVTCPDCQTSPEYLKDVEKRRIAERRYFTWARHLITDEPPYDYLWGAVQNWSAVPGLDGTPDHFMRAAQTCALIDIAASLRVLSGRSEVGEQL